MDELTRIEIKILRKAARLLFNPKHTSPYKGICHCIIFAHSDMVKVLGPDKLINLDEQLIAMCMAHAINPTKALIRWDHWWPLNGRYLKRRQKTIDAVIDTLKKSSDGN